MKKPFNLLLLALLCGTSIIALSSCKKKTDEIDLSSTHTTAAVSETMSETTALSEAETIAPTTAETQEVESLSTKLETYTNNSVSISYPAISGMNNETLQASINDLLKKNALSVIQGCDIDESTCVVSIKAKVIDIDRKRIAVTYTGSINSGGAYPLNTFYSNTIDLTTGKDIGFSDYNDAYTMAGYVLSDDVLLADGTSKSITEEFMRIRKDTSLEDYTNMFSSADFPISTGADGKITYENWPYSFSYEDGGDIVFSVPVPHALGDYVLIKYSPTTK